MNYTQTISAQRTCSKRIKGKTNFICVLHFVLRSFYNDGLFICGAKFLYFHIFIMTEQLTNSTENSTKNEHQTHDIKTGDQVRVDSHSPHLVRRPCWKNSISKGRKITSLNRALHSRNLSQITNHLFSILYHASPFCHNLFPLFVRAPNIRHRRYMMV